MAGEIRTKMLRTDDLSPRSFLIGVRLRNHMYTSDVSVSGKLTTIQCQNREQDSLGKEASRERDNVLVDDEKIREILDRVSKDQKVSESYPGERE